MSSDRGKNSLLKSAVLHEAGAAACSLAELEYTLGKLAVCIASLYRENELPPQLNQLLFDPDLADRAKVMAAKLWVDDAFNAAYNPTPERLWPGFLIESVLIGQPINSSGLIIDHDLLIDGIPSKHISCADNQTFTFDELNLQIDAAALCHAHLDPFIKGSVEMFRKALKIEGPFNLGIMETVYDSVAYTDPYEVAENPLAWFTEEYYAMLEIDSFDDVEDGFGMNGAGPVIN